MLDLSGKSTEAGSSSIPVGCLSLYKDAGEENGTLPPPLEQGYFLADA